MVAAWRLGQHRLDLHAPADAASANDDVVAFAVAPGLGDGQASAGGFAHEGELGELSAMFVIEFGRVLKFGLWSFW